MTRHNALRPGHYLHWYRIDAVIGQGGFGITYLAQDENLRENVAIKEYFPSQFAARSTTGSVQQISEAHLDDYRWGLERFINEARTLTQFRHPCIVRVRSVFEENNTAYMVMDYVEGESLAASLKNKQRLSEQTLLSLFLPLMDGLVSVHQAGFIHRDIKPANIMVAEDRAVLIDFGSARQAVGERSISMTQIVSAGYAPFEQYQSREGGQGPWTDIYAMGATMYKAATGVVPPQAIDRSRALLETSRDIYVSAAELCGREFSDSFLKAIDHALAFQVADRPPDIAHWRAEFGSSAADSAAVSGDDAPAELDETVRKTVLTRAAAEGKLLRIGECVLDLSSGELEREGARHLLPEQPFRVLELLAAHPHEVVSRETLKARLWPRNTFVDFDTGLNAAVRKLRAALGDDAEAPRYIETLPKRGYRCIASVEVISLPESVEKSSAGVEGGTSAGQMPPVEEARIGEPLLPEGSKRVAAPVVPPRWSWDWRKARFQWSLAVGFVVVTVIGTLLYLSRGPVELPAPETPAVELKTIAVLPFVNLSDEPDTEYFSDGLAEELLGLLARQHVFRVTARTSSFQFRDRNQDVREIGKLLGVRYLIEGSVRRDGEQVRTGATLIDAESGFQLWEGNYDHTLADLFAIQEDIATQVAQALQVVLVQGDGARLSPRPPANVSAQELLMQGRYVSEHAHTNEGRQQAVDLFRRAVAADPQSAIAYVRLGGALLDADEVENAEAPVRKALELDPYLSDAHAALGVFLRFSRKPGGGAAYRRAVELNPNNAWAAFSLSSYLNHHNQLAESFQYLRRAAELDPLVLKYQRELGLYLAWDTGRSKETLAQIARIEKLFPDARGYMAISGIWEQLGAPDEVIAWALKARALEPDWDEPVDVVVRALANMGEMELATRYDTGDDKGTKRRREILLAQHRWADAVSQMQASLAADPTPDDWMVLQLAFALNVSGRSAEAITLLESFRLPGEAINDDVRQFFGVFALTQYAAALSTVGRTDEARRYAQWLVDFNSPRKAYGFDGRVLWFEEAEAYALLGQRDPALDALEHALAGDFIYETQALDSIALATLKDDPRFTAAAARLKARWQEARKRLPETLSRHGLSDAL